MANPALKNGYLSIATELVEKLATIVISSSEMRLIWIVWRKTWGWKNGDRHKDFDAIAISQFIKMTGLSKRNIIYCLQQLEVKNILFIHRNISNGEKGTNTYSFNQNYDTWVVQNSAPQVKKNREIAKIGSAKLRKIKKEGGGSAKLSKKVVQNSVKNLPSFAHTIERVKERGTKDIPASQELLKTKEKKMKKNRLGSYKETDSSDSYEEVVNAETGETETVQKGNVLKAYKEIIDWAEQRRGSKFVNYKKQFKALSMCKEANKTPSEVKNRWSEMEKDNFWKEKGFDFMSVYSSFDRK